MRKLNLSARSSPTFSQTDNQSTGCKPIADIDSFTEDKLGYAELVDEVQSSGERVVKITGVKNQGKTISVLVRGANMLVLEEAERSLHDALCVIRCLVKRKSYTPLTKLILEH